MNNNLKTTGLILLSFLFLTAGCSKSSPALPTANSSASDYNRTLKINGKILHVQAVSTQQDMARGLSGRDILDFNQGMLFDLGSGTKEQPKFWMKDMKFGLDFVWIQNSKVVGITPDVPAPKSSSGQLSDYTPPAPADKVLEVNAGWTKANNIKTGDEVRLID